MGERDIFFKVDLAGERKREVYGFHSESADLMGKWETRGMFTSRVPTLKQEKDESLDFNERYFTIHNSSNLP